MKALVSAAIVGTLLLGPRLPARAASSPSEWPCINGNAGQTNMNAAEKALTTRNVLHLRVRWSAGLPGASYPVVAGGRVYTPYQSKSNGVRVHALDAHSGKQVGTYSRDAQGGILARSGSLYFAGGTLDQVNPATGARTGQIKPSPKVAGGSFWYPVADSKAVFSGYASPGTSQAALYTTAPDSTKIYWKAPSTSAQAALGNQRVMTQVSIGSAFYDESSGHVAAWERNISSDWFAGKYLMYTVLSNGRQKATLYAFNKYGKRMWQRTVGGKINVLDWPHAAASDRLYIHNLKGHEGIQALDPKTGKVYWNRQLGNIVRIAATKDLVFALTFSLNQPVRLVVLNAKTGARIGSLAFSSSYYAFDEPNGLMVASGMVFVRVIGPSGGDRLVALSP